ncbi:hypothetical protein ACJ72_06362 [Emergomyces africanus]|uniref:Uncharacterized protein n=1 Tax=Emergomyces africanus TaxID=1955775 RepID=A0A1B7NRA6_9EURO|nr:hypothetical protein ACJ72_06362 [Emergomyces africanus]
MPRTHPSRAWAIPISRPSAAALGIKRAAQSIPEDGQQTYKYGRITRSMKRGDGVLEKGEKVIQKKRYGDVGWLTREEQQLANEGLAELEALCSENLLRGKWRHPLMNHMTQIARVAIHPMETLEKRWRMANIPLVPIEEGLREGTEEEGQQQQDAQAGPQEINIKPSEQQRRHGGVCSPSAQQQCPPPTGPPQVGARLHLNPKND